MNGTLNSINGEHQCRRPIITCAGELEVFSSIEDDILQALPQDTCEWKRSLGRTTRLVKIEATFTAFSAPALPKTTQWDLIRQPLFHIYWTECNDLESYKTSVKDDIELWLKELSQKDIPDWLVVVVENYDGKRTNKLLPRTTVLDKIRTDFATKQGDRCISVINPGRVETRSADSWRGLIARIRHLLLVSYAKAITKLEDYIRQQREKRNDPAWKFMEYFRLQEELAQILEMLGLYDEALVQYDELDALFSQFVVNCQNGDNVPWLSDFQKPLEKWHGLRLGPCSLNSYPSLLELRAYLFAKQAHMLLHLNKIWEVAFRCLPFIYTCTREFLFLEISAPNGALACWLFLACMEVLQSCNKYNGPEQIEANSLHTASLWAYASQKLRCLGELCGLMPGGRPTSDQLHTVVYLSAGMGDNPGKPESPSPTDKLKQALCSQAAFNKTYLELAEFAMGTFKLIGRMRSARLVGKEVASFYMLLGEVQKAAAFLTDALRTFEQDNWKELVAQTQVELADCYKLSGDTRKFIRAAAASAAAPEIDNLIRWKYFDEMKKSIDLVDRTIIVPFKDMIRIVSVQIKNDTDIIQDNDINVELNLFSNFPREFVCEEILISIENDGKDSKKVRRSSSNAISGKDLKHQDISQQRLRIQRHLDYKQDKQLSSANVVCRNSPLKRADSNAAPLFHSDFNYCAKSLITPMVISPGINWIRLSTKATELGKFYLAQIAIHIKLMELVSTALTPRLSFEVTRHEPVLRFDKCEGTLFSGIEQIMKLTVTVGSYAIEPNTTVKLTASLGLQIQNDRDALLASKLEIPIEQIQPYATTSIPIRILADIPSKEHQVTISCPWLAKPLPVLLSFTSPLTTSWRLHTVKNQKFIQLNVTSQSEKDMQLSDAQLSFNSGIKVKIFNDLSSQNISLGMSLSYVYEVLIDYSDETNTTKGTFNIKYTIGSLETINYNFHFELKDFKTLYTVIAKVEPTKGSEFCRVGALCHLELQITSSGDNPHQNINSLMYEVLAEQSLWAVCGRTAGVISFDNNSNAQIVILDVMPLTSGYLPLPLVCLSKYIPADYGVKEIINKTDQHPRLEPFSVGQVYNASKGQQVYVINSGSDGHPVIS